MASSELPQFPLLQHYKLAAVLGHGGQGVVSRYERKDSLLLYMPEQVAVKSFQPSGRSSRQPEDVMRRELEHMIKIAANSHPNIVKCYGKCELEAGQVGIVMELFHSDLDKYLSGKCSVQMAKIVMRQLAGGLKHLKGHDIVHRDVKPENILVRYGAGCGTAIQVALTDLGVAKYLPSTQQSDQVGNSIDSGHFRAAFQATFGAAFWVIFCPIELGMEHQ